MQQIPMKPTNGSGNLLIDNDVVLAIPSNRVYTTRAPSISRVILNPDLSAATSTGTEGLHPKLLSGQAREGRDALPI